jgi:GTP-binding protein EngB required for normal cell division
VTIQALPAVGMPYTNLPARLDALAELVRIGGTRGGQDGFSPELLSDSDALLRRAGERLRLSASHTVVALAGGTGSGKSSLFNALAGASFSPAGVTRPTTRHVHACVWGMQGAAPLLDWLGVQRRHRYGRASALDGGEAALTGLLLLDLPDHDSVVTASMAAVDRLSKLADMLIWVLDPQKYADASVHRRYLIPLAGHARVITVVLNQIDLLTAEQVADCENDLRRLLDSEGLAETQLLPVSARSGTGMNELRTVLTDAVSASNAASERIAADIAAVIGGFAEHVSDVAVSGTDGSGANGSGSALDAQDPEADVADEAASDGAVAGGARRNVPPWENEGADAGNPLTGDPPFTAPPFDSIVGESEPDAAPAAAPVSDAQAGGAAAWGRASTASRPPWEDATPDGTSAAASAADSVALVPAQPAAELAAAFGRAAGLGAVTDAMQGVREAHAARFIGWPVAKLARSRRRQRLVRGLRPGGPGAGARSITATAGQAQRSDIDNAITSFADEVSAPLPEPWSRTVREAARSGSEEVQQALTSAVRESIPPQDRVTAWWRLVQLWQWLLVVLAVAGVAWIAVIASGQSSRKTSTLLSDTSLIPWLAVMVAAILLLGWLTGSGCQNLVLLAADRERDTAEALMRSRVNAVARDLVLVPVGREIAEYEHFRRELAIASGTPIPDPLFPAALVPDAQVSAALATRTRT